MSQEFMSFEAFLLIAVGIYLLICVGVYFLLMYGIRRVYAKHGSLHDDDFPRSTRILLKILVAAISLHLPGQFFSFLGWIFS